MNFKYLKSIVRFSLLVLIFASNSFAGDRAGFQSIFNQYQANGTLVILDARGDKAQFHLYNQSRAKQRFSPASTYKIPHTLFALDYDLVRSDQQLFKWDGVTRKYASHNSDQTIGSAFKNSVVWVYRSFAKQIPAETLSQYLQKINYGNQQSSAEKGDYWIEGDLAISAYEQIAFLQKLFDKSLAFKYRHMEMLIEIMQVKQTNQWTLRAKTGWNGQVGWWVGWVEFNNGPIFFALNIDTPNREKDLYKRQAIVKKAFKSLGILIE